MDREMARKSDVDLLKSYIIAKFWMVIVELQSELFHSN